MSGSTPYSQQLTPEQRQILGMIPSRADRFEGALDALREEIAALRRELKPPHSIIITGAEVERVFASLKNGAA